MTTTAALRRVCAVPQAIDATMMARVHLGYREVLSLTSVTPGLQIVSDRCTLWLTQDGMIDDLILRPGERYTAPQSQRVVLQGMG